MRKGIFRIATRTTWTLDSWRRHDCRWTNAGNTLIKRAFERSKARNWI